jgi:hypothetical protein
VGGPGATATATDHAELDGVIFGRMGETFRRKCGDGDSAGSGAEKFATIDVRGRVV